MSFFLGAESRAKLVGVHPGLVQVVEEAILITAQDFSVHCGTRSHAAQRRFVANGTSWTMTSKHLPQADGFAHAVDLVPFIDGVLRWEWPGCYVIAAAVSEAATTLDVPVVWGGVWDRLLSNYAATEAGVRAATANYVARRRKLGKRTSTDGPHFELVAQTPKECHNRSDVTWPTPLAFLPHSEAQNPTSQFRGRPDRAAELLSHPPDPFGPAFDQAGQRDSYILLKTDLCGAQSTGEALTLRKSDIISSPVRLRQCNIGE